MSEHPRRASRAPFSALAATLPLLVAGVIGGCHVSKEPPKVPLESAVASAAASDAPDERAGRLPAPARAAIDRANAEYRAGNYADALVDYRAAVNAAPNEPAAYFGIYMVAQKQGNKPLADSALKVIQASSGLSDSALRDVHVNTKTGSPHKG